MSHLLRAQMLLQTGRAAEALQMLQPALAESPEDPEAHRLLALGHLMLEQYPPAEEAARRAVGLAPDAPQMHDALARVLLYRNRNQEAEASARETLRLDPEDPDSHELNAIVAMRRERWKEALAFAEQGLEVDPEHQGCLNLRSRALVLLGRTAEAGPALDVALAQDPDDAHSHAARGWELLHARDPKQAREHFREALRLDPGSEWARTGMVEAIKARNPFYALLLRYGLWMISLSPRVRGAVIIGAFVLIQFAAKIQRAQPELGPYLDPLIWFYFAFVLTSWLGSPLFDLFLMASPYGRSTLRRGERWSASLLGVLLGSAALFLVLSKTTGSDFWVNAAAGFGTLAIPVTSCFVASAGWPRKVAILISGALGLMCLGGLVFYLYQPWGDIGRLGYAALFYAFFGNLLSTWVLGVVRNREPRR